VTATLSAATQAVSDRFVVSPAEILFLSDIVAELDAASAAGLQTRLVVRPGNAPAPNGHRHSVVRSFDALM
jgi:enolase-phosphatase E1